MPAAAGEKQEPLSQSARSEMYDRHCTRLPRRADSGWVSRQREGGDERPTLSTVSQSGEAHRIRNRVPPRHQVAESYPAGAGAPQAAKGDLSRQPLSAVHQDSRGQKTWSGVSGRGRTPAIAVMATERCGSRPRATLTGCHPTGSSLGVAPFAGGSSRETFVSARNGRPTIANTSGACRLELRTTVLRSRTRATTPRIDHLAHRKMVRGPVVLGVDGVEHPQAHGCTTAKTATGHGRPGTNIHVLPCTREETGSANQRGNCTRGAHRRRQRSRPAKVGSTGGGGLLHTRRCTTVMPPTGRGPRGCTWGPTKRLRED